MMENTTNVSGNQGQNPDLFFEKEEKVPTKELLLVELDGELYAVPVTEIEMVMKIPPVTAVPNAPEAIVGIFHLRGKVIVAIDLLKRMNLARKSTLIPYYLFVVHRDKNYFGVMVDRTRTVLRVPEEQITPLDAMTAARVPDRYASGTFIYKEKITVKNTASGKGIMIEPKSNTESSPTEPIFTERPVVILDLGSVLNEAELKGEMNQTFAPETSLPSQ